MGFLAFSWLIIESIVIPDGYFLKWFYLSFYIHPLFLFGCQIFLWLKVLKRCIIYPFRIISIIGLCAFRFCKYWIISLFRHQVEEVEVSNYGENEVVRLSACSTAISFNTKVLVDEFENGRENSHMHMEDWSFCLQKKDLDDCSYYSSPSIGEEQLNEYSPLMKRYSSPPPGPGCSSSSSSLERQAEAEAEAEAETETETETETEAAESEEFYKKYAQRMGWFDVLNYERSCGISAMEEDLRIPYISVSKSEKKMLLSSLQSDLELVYVAQSCLTWEALHHEYRKVKFLTFSNYLFSDNVAAQFQDFHVLLERFLEEETYIYPRKRVFNYVKARFASHTLLQVPQLSECLDQKKREEIRGNVVHAKDVLQAIENCIRVFGKFVTTDRKRPWWKLNSSKSIYPPIEDPNDLELFVDITTTLQKKKLWLKELEGKKRCLLNKAVNAVEESQKETILFTTIEMKLVSRVLQMSIVTSSQLKWCQEKLGNIEFNRGRLFRTVGPLFPSS